MLYLYETTYPSGRSVERPYTVGLGPSTGSGRTYYPWVCCGQ
jgi:hypothetical protein